MTKVIIAGYTEDSPSKRHVTYGDIKQDERAGTEALKRYDWQELRLPISFSTIRWTVVAPNELLEWNND